MQKKTVYLAGKITDDPFYRSKFYEAQKKLEECGYIVVNPATAFGGLRVGSLYANGGRNAERMRRSLLPSGLEREQRREI